MEATHLSNYLLLVLPTDFVFLSTVIEDKIDMDTSLSVFTVVTYINLSGVFNDSASYKVLTSIAHILYNRSIYLFFYGSKIYFKFYKRYGCTG